MSTFQNEEENRAMTLTETDRINITDIYKDMKRKFSRLLVSFSVAQIIIGILCVIINSASLAKPSTAYYRNTIAILYAFFTSFTFIVTGAIGSAAGKAKKKCLVVSFNVLCIISASLCVYLLILSIVYLSIADICYGHYSYIDDAACRSEANARNVLETVLIILTLLEVGLAIGSSVVCCTIGACCCDCDCGCCCPPTIPRYQRIHNNVPQTRVPDRQQPGGIPRLQPATMFRYPSQPTYMPDTNQMTAPLSQQRPTIQLRPSEQVAQYAPRQLSASSSFQHLESSGRGSSTGTYNYETMSVSQTKANRGPPRGDL